MKKPPKTKRKCLRSWEGPCPNFLQVYCEDTVMQRKVLMYSSTRVHNRGAEMLNTNLDMTVFLPVSSTVRQMTPVFFQLNTDLEIIIQVPAKYRFGDGE